MDTGLIYAALPDLLDGVGVTLLLTAFAVSTGFLIAWPLAFARLSNNALLVHTALAYGYLFRGTPLLVQLYLVYYGLSQYRVVLEEGRALVAVPRSSTLLAPGSLAQHCGVLR